MIAVTQAAADRGWVAVPSYESLRDQNRWLYELAYAHLHLPEADLTGTTVAVVERRTFPYPLSAYDLTGFAEVAEVLPVHEPPGTEPCPIYQDSPHICIENGATYLLDAVADEDIDLPGAEHGGLALRLEPIECTPDCYGGIVDQCSITGESCPFTGIGSPVSVVDWSGEIGRWDR